MKGSSLTFEERNILAGMRGHIFSSEKIIFEQHRKTLVPPSFNGKKAYLHINLAYV